MRLILVILVVLLMMTQYRLWFGEGGLHEIRHRQTEVENLKAENDRLQKRNDALRADVEDLKEGLEAVEEHARSELGMIKDGETFFQVVGDPVDMRSSTSSPASSD